MSTSQPKKKIHKSLSTTDLHSKPSSFHLTNIQDKTFSRTSNMKTPNINGSAAEVIYKRPVRVPHNYDLTLHDSGYIVDGGLSQKYLNLLKSKSSSSHKPTNTASIPLKKETHRVLKSQKSAGNLLISPSSSITSKISSNINERKKMNKTAHIPKPKKTNNYFSSSKSSAKLSNTNNTYKNNNNKNSINNNNKKWNNSTKIEKESLSKHNNPKTKRKLMRSYSQGELHVSSLTDKLTNQEDIKLAQIERLVDNGVALYIKELQQQEENKDKSKINFLRKQKVLESLNQDSLELESAVTDLSHNSHEEIENSKDNNNNNVDNSNNNNNNTNSLKHQQRMHMHHKHKSDNTLVTALTKDKKVLKCRVDQMEYMKQIFKNQKLKHNNNNNIIGDSFRQTTSPNKERKRHSYNIDSKIKQVNDDEGNYLFSYQPTKKEKQKELRKYMKTKRIHEKQNQEQKEFEKNKELLQLFGRIYPLNKGNCGEYESTYKSKIKSRSIKNNNNKEDESNVSHHSTLIGADEFYYSAFICQQLIGMDEDEILNLKVQESESQSHNNNNNSNNKLNNPFDKSSSSRHTEDTHAHARENKTIPMKEEIEGLKNKVGKTLTKADNIYKKEEIEELIKSNSNSNTNGSKPKIKNDNNNKHKQDINNNTNQHETKFPKDSLEISNQKEPNINEQQQQQHSPLPHNNNNNEDDIIKSTSEEVLDTKEQNLPSLSHSFNSNTNPNNKIKIEIEPRCVLNLVEIVKLIIQRRTLRTLYEIFINELLCQRYTIAFAYFIAVIKQYPYRTIEAYVTYKTYYKAFKTLFIPFIRRNFYYFLMKTQSNQKVEYLVNLLTKFIKLKSMEKIYIYGMVRQSQLEGEAFMDILTKIVKCVAKPSLTEHFRCFVDKCNNINVHMMKDHQDPLVYVSNDSKSIERLMMLPSEFGSEDELKMNTYMYESFVNTSKDASSYMLEFNSAESPKLRRLFQKFLAKNQGEFDIETMKDKTKKRLNPFHLGNNNNNKVNSNSKQPSKYNNNNNNILNETDDDQLNFFRKTNHEVKDNISSLLNISNISNKSIKSFNGISNTKNKLDLSLSGNNSINDNKHSSLFINTERNRGRRKIHKQPISFPKSSSNNKKLQITTNMLYNGDIPHPKPNELKSEKDRIFLPSSSSPSQKETPIKKDMLTDKTPTPLKDFSLTPISSNSNGIKKKKSLEIHTDQDYSIDKESNNDIDWQYCISSSKTPGKDITDGISSDNVNKKEEIIVDIKSPIDKPIHHNVNDDKKEEINDEYSYEKYGDDFEQGNYNNISSKGSFDAMDNIIGSIRNEVNQQEQFNNNINDKSRNTPHTISSKVSEQDKTKTITEDNKRLNNEQYIINIKEMFTKIDKDTLTNDIMNDIVKSLIESEIKNIKKIIPTKASTYKDNNNNIMNTSLNPSISLSRSGSLNNSNPECKLPSSDNNNNNNKKEASALPQLSSSSSGTTTTMQNISNPLLSDSLYFMPFTYSSIFNKTVKEKKKEQSTQLYNTKIGPELIKLIKKEIIDKYPLIYNNISTPYQNIPEGLMTSLSLQDPELLRVNYRVPPLQTEIAEIIDKPKIINEFIPINKAIRVRENILSKENYDMMLNNCLVDSAIELINKERMYGEQGDPLPWSNRTREIKYKYEKDNPFKLAEFIEKELMKLLNNKIGMITENYDYMSIDQINLERERKLVEMIKGELKENEMIWNNLEMEETQLKVEVTELILEQLYNEVIEILEHIEYSRKKPELYQNKSIFACEEIPKLTFQVTGTEEQEDEHDWTRM